MNNQLENKKDLFYYVNNIYTKKEIPEDSEVKSFIWSVNRFLSMEKELLETIAYLSRYMFTLGSKYYRLVLRVVPQSFAPRNKYLKVEKESDSELLDRYVHYFRLSKKEVRDYLKILFKQYSKKEVYGFVGLEEKS